MKWIYILLILTLFLCNSGIVSAANDTKSDVSKMVDMNKVKAHAVSFWDSTNENGDAGYMIIGMFLAAVIIIVLVMSLAGTGKYSLGGKTKDANETNEGRKMLSNQVEAVVGLVVVLIIIGVFLGLL